MEGKFSNYVLESDGLLIHYGRIYIPLMDELCTLILLEAHHVPYSTHLGIKKMHVDLQCLFYWTRMNHDIVNFVARFLECQRVKAEHHHLTGFL